MRRRQEWISSICLPFETWKRLVSASLLACLGKLVHREQRIATGPEPTYNTAACHPLCTTTQPFVSILVSSGRLKGCLTQSNRISTAIAGVFLLEIETSDLRIDASKLKTAFVGMDFVSSGGNVERMQSMNCDMKLINTDVSRITQNGVEMEHS